MLTARLNTFYRQKSNASKLSQYFHLNILSVFSFIIAVFTLLPIRLLKLVKHILFIDFNSPRNEKWWFWLALLPFKVIDCLLIPELLNLGFTLVKFNSRFLTPTEIEEAQKVYGNRFPFWKISLDSFSLFAWLGAKSNGSKTLGIVVFNSVNFNCPIYCAPHNHNMGWLIHELTHITQFNTVGSAYIFYALYAQHTSGYTLSEIEQNHLNLYNFEQQAEIARVHYFNQEKYTTLKPELQSAKFL